MKRQHLKILIIDDSPEDRQIFQRLLKNDQNCEYAFNQIETGDEGLDILKAETMDCVLLDYNLPDMNGIEFLNALAQFDLLKDIPVIFLTGQGNEKVAVEAMKSGVSDYLAKSSITEELLIRSIQYAVQKKSSERARRQSERLQGALEMAGAVCHEFNQPLQAISGYADLLMLDLPQEDPLYDKLSIIKNEVARIGRLNQKLMGVVRYETKDYAIGGKIIDLDKSSSDR